MPRLPLLTATSLVVLGLLSSGRANADPQYVITVGRMTVWDGVSSGPFAKDTDYITLHIVRSSGGTEQGWTLTGGPVQLGRNDVYDWHLVSDPITVPADIRAHLTVNFAVVNNGNSDQEKFKSTLAQAIGKTAPGGDVGKTIGQYLANFGLGLVFKDCDTVLFGDSLEFNGLNLANVGPSGFHPEGPNQWELVFGYGGPDVNKSGGGYNGDINIPGGCDSGANYNIQIHIRQQ